MKDSTKGRMAKRNKELSYIDWCIKEPKPEKNVRYIKQVTDSKGRILDSSKVVTAKVSQGRLILNGYIEKPGKFFYRKASYWDTFNWMRAFYLGIAIGLIILWVTLK